MTFKDREEAGKRLGEELQSGNMRPDLVLPIPRGGLPVGRKVADFLNAELDVVVASKIGAPGNPELGIGAVASDGSYWLNQDMIESHEIPEEFVEESIEREASNASEKLEFMRGEEELPEIRGRKTVVVDDGIATGGTAIACLRQLRKGGAEEVILAVPVGPQDAEEKLKDEAGEIVILETPEVFGSVGSHYRNFKQVTDEEAKAYLR